MLDGLSQALLWMVIQEQQNTDELTSSRMSSMGVGEDLSQSRECLGQLPLTEDIRVVKASWLALQNWKEVTRIEDLFIAFVAAPMRGDRFAAIGQFDTVDIPLDPDRAKGERMRHAVTVLIEGNGLVLVGLRRLLDAWIEGPVGQCERTGQILLESLSDRLLALGCLPVKIPSATLDQVVIEPIQVLGTRNRRGQAALKVFDAILDSRLLVAASRHAKQRLEVVMAGKSQIPLVQLALTA